MKKQFFQARFAPQRHRTFSVLALNASIITFWITIVILLPVNMWSIPVDGPILAIGNAANLDFWIFGEGQRYVTNPQVSHPGVFSQIFNWLIYRLAAPSFGMTPEQLIVSHIENSTKLWLWLQALPLAYTLLATNLFLYLIKNATLGNALVCAACPFISINFVHMAVYVPYNESLSLLIAVLFFPIALWLLKRLIGLSPAQNNRTLIVLGITFGVSTACLFLHKLQQRLSPCIE